MFLKHASLFCYNYLLLTLNVYEIDLSSQFHKYFTGTSYSSIKISCTTIHCICVHMQCFLKCPSLFCYNCLLCKKSVDEIGMSGQFHKYFTGVSHAPSKISCIIINCMYAHIQCF